MKNRSLLFALFCSGAAALIYQIAWIRPIGIVFHSTLYLVAVVTTAFMVGLGAGSLYAGSLSKSPRPPLLFYALFEIGIGLYGLLILEIFTLLPDINQKLLSISDPSRYHLNLFISILLILGLPTAMMGATFSFVVAANREESSGRSVGGIYAANNLGAIVGVLAAGHFLVPFLGIKGTTLVAVALNLAAGAIGLWWIRESISRTSLFTWISVTAALVAVLASTTRYDLEHIYRGGMFGLGGKDYLGEREMVFSREGQLANVVVIKESEGNSDAVFRLLLNGQGSSSLRPHDARVSTILGYFPRLLRPDLENAAVIGFGVGGTSRVLSASIPTTTIEIEPAVLEAAPYFAPLNGGVLEDPRHTIVFGDARHFFARTEESFGIIVNHPMDPNFGASSGLFTREFFEQVADRLTPDGFYVQWVPLYNLTRQNFSDLLATLGENFPYYVVFGDTPDRPSEVAFLCSRIPIDLDADRLRERFETRSTTDRRLLAKVGLNSFHSLWELHAFDEQDLAEYAGRGEVLTDDRPRLEFEIPLNSIRKISRSENSLINELSDLQLSRQYGPKR
jgi:predicted membrane-bound spermidine synthase